ncbi:MAG: PTS glucose transporter subunit IIA, partial [Novosphingobium sp.]
MPALVLKAPFAGRAMALSESPDPVFSQGLVGDGIAIDPSMGQVRAPCAGVIASLQASGHALTVRAQNGAELLIHVGVDTVNLKGAGFTLRASEGQTIAEGDVLIEFDMDAIRPKVPSLVSMMVVANGDDFTVADQAVGRTVGFGDAVMSVTPKGTDANADTTDGENAVDISV